MELSKKSDDDLGNMMAEVIAKSGSKAEPAKAADAAPKAAEDDADAVKAKAVEDAVVDRILGNPFYGYGGLYHPMFPLSPLYAPPVYRTNPFGNLKAYTDIVSGLYPYAGVMNPAVADAVKAYEAKTAETLKGDKKPDAPKAAAFLQFAEGMNDDESTVLQVHGVPVLVKPKLLDDEMADAEFDETMAVGGAKTHFAQKDAEGVPVLVNPVVMQNTVAYDDLGQEIRVGADTVHYRKNKDPLS